MRITYIASITICFLAIMVGGCGSLLPAISGPASALMSAMVASLPIVLIIDRVMALSLEIELNREHIRADLGALRASVKAQLDGLTQHTDATLQRMDTMMAALAATSARQEQIPDTENGTGHLA
jgi:hypothetical protein